MRPLFRSFAIAIFSVPLLTASAQLPSSVDITLVESTVPGMRDVRLRANGASFNGTLNTLAFTVRCASYYATFGDPESTCPTALPLTTTYPVWVWTDGYTYKTYTSSGSEPLSVDGCVLPADTWTTVGTIRVSVSEGCMECNITNDAWTTANNRNYKAILNGTDVTGSILGGSFSGCAPTNVDITMVPSTTLGRLEVRLRANGEAYHDIMSGLTFTVRWPATSTASLGNGTLLCPDAMPAVPVAQVVTGGYKYRTFNGLSIEFLNVSGCSWPADTWVTLCTIPLINNTGCTTFSIVNDTWTGQNNRNFWVELGGYEMTGAIIPNAVTLCPTDCQGVANGAAQPGTACDDANACTTNDGWSLACVCAGTTTPDSDGDGTCDALDGCPNDADKTAPGICGCGNPEPGTACDDNDVDTYNDVVSALCVCQGSTDCELLAKVFLEGPYVPADGRMEDHLRDAGLIPATEPYGALGYTFVGGGSETAGGSVFADNDINTAKVDWVIVELRSTANPATIVASRAGLLCRNGAITDELGGLPLRIKVTPGTYYVAIRHRNHAGVMTAAPYTFTPGVPLPLDLTQTATAVYGTSARKNVSGTETLWAGDATFNGAIKYTGSGNDRDPIFVTVGSTTPNNTVNAYSTRDTNMDGVVKYTGSGNDRDPILVNVGSTTPNNVRLQQLP